MHHNWVDFHRVHRRRMVRLDSSEIIASYFNNQGLSLVWIYLWWTFFLVISIVLPGFLTSQTNSYEMITPFTIFTLGILFIGCWWSAYLLFYIIRPASIKAQTIRLALAPAVCLSSATLFALACGYPSNWFHSAGKYYEKIGDVSTSLWCYEQSLIKKPSSIHASYLQYRIALLSHKMGESEKAIGGFRKVVSVYNHNQQLVTKANQFLDNIERNQGQGVRFVLPGVENPTTYKGAYCVPNSLALVMNYWNAGVEAGEIGEEITSLNSGTMTIDQAWFAENRGFKHSFMPMAEVEDIKKTIDAGFPVLVYVPQHVFVIVGYDENLETFVTYDVATRDVWVEYLQNDFLKSWKKENATMVVVYPESEEAKIPIQVLTALTDKTDNYIQYHLHYLQTANEYSSIYHLQSASKSSSSYFFPLVTLYNEFPSYRKEATSHHDLSAVTQSILNYYSRGFDEGTHLAGQFHYADYATTDKDLKKTISFLIGTRQLNEGKQLIEQIKDNGVVSATTKKSLAMINLALGDFDSALLQLEEQSSAQLQFYLAQTYLEQGKTRNAIPGLIKTIDDCT